MELFLLYMLYYLLYGKLVTRLFGRRTKLRQIFFCNISRYRVCRDFCEIIIFTLIRSVIIQLIDKTSSREKINC